MDTLTQAQTDWLTDFQRKLSDLEADYHFWQNAEDRRRLNKQAEYQTELNHKATVSNDRHTDAMRHFTEWVQAHPYPATDQTAPTQAQTVADKEQYRSGWEDAMFGVKDLQRQGKSPQEWAERMCALLTDLLANNHADAYNRGSSDALTHFLQSGQTDRHAP